MSHKRVIAVRAQLVADAEMNDPGPVVKFPVAGGPKGEIEMRRFDRTSYRRAVGQEEPQIVDVYVNVDPSLRSCEPIDIMLQMATRDGYLQGQQDGAVRAGMERGKGIPVAKLSQFLCTLLIDNLTNTLRHHAEQRAGALDRLMRGANPITVGDERLIRKIEDRAISLTRAGDLLASLLYEDKEVKSSHVSATLEGWRREREWVTLCKGWQNGTGDN